VYGVALLEASRSVASGDGSIARLADFLRAEQGAILAAWQRRIETLPASDAPSLSAHGPRMIEWVASSLGERSRNEPRTRELPGDESFSPARAIAELALLTESIGQLQPPALDHVARDALHRVIDGAIAHSLARDIEESDRLRMRLRLATTVTAVGSWELDPRTGGVAADERSRELFGTADSARTVEALTANLHPDDRARLRDGISTAIASGAPYVDRCRAPRIEGGHRWIAIACDGHRGHAASTSLLGIVHDISDQKRAEVEQARVIEELSRAVHISEMFVGILSHDLRNPLSAVLSGAHLLGMSSTDERSKRVVSRIVSSGQRMGRMIDQLLDFTRARLGEGLAIGSVEMDLAPLVSEVVEEGRSSNPTAVLGMTERGDTRGTWDRDRLAQVVSNLVGNALQHGEAAGAIDVLLDGSNPAHVVLDIVNRGSISADLLPVIFNPFRGTVHKNDKSRGLGLGLYVARQIALAHGGELEVHSTPEGTVIFRLRLPRSPPAAKSLADKLAGDDELAALERVSAPLSVSAVTARLFGSTPFHERAPIEHADIVERYKSLLERALNKKAFRGPEESLAAELRGLADRLGDLGAGPREVTDVHGTAIREAVRGVTPARSQALLSEGRLLALELMGGLTAYYRRRFRGETRKDTR